MTACQSGSTADGGGGKRLRGSYWWKKGGRKKEELKGAREKISFSFSPVAVACIDWALSVACYRQRCLHQEHFTAFCWSRLQTDWFNWLWLESQCWVGDSFFLFVSNAYISGLLVMEQQVTIFFVNRGRSRLKHIHLKEDQNTADSFQVWEDIRQTLAGRHTNKIYLWNNISILRSTILRTNSAVIIN